MKESETDHGIEKTRKDYNQIAEHFSCTRQEPWPIVQYCLQQYAHPGDHVLDIGCGNGRVADITSKIKVNYTGLDLSSRLIDIARERHPYTTFVVGSMTALPFPDATFALALFVASFHHLPSRQSRRQALLECARVLKPGGIAIMINWNLWQPAFWGQHVQHGWRKPRARGDLLIPWKNANGEIIIERYYHAITKREMRQLVRETPLHIVEQYHEYNGVRTHWWKGKNLVTMLQHSS